MADYMEVCRFCLTVLDVDDPHCCPQSQSNPQSNQQTTFTWHERPTRLLISMYGDRRKDLDNPHIKKKQVWEEMAAGLKEKGYPVDRTQVENKLKSLINQYKKAKDHNNKSGNGRKTSPYFMELDSILCNSPDVNPVSGASSSQGFSLRENLESPAPENDTSHTIRKTPSRKRRLESDEPEWFKNYRAQAQRNHEERMEVNRQFLEILKKFVPQ